MFASVWAHPFSALAGNGGDSRQFVWFISWPAFALSHGINPLRSDYIFWPQGLNLMWNTSILLPATLLAPLNLWLGPIFSYNLLVTLAPALSAWTGYLLIRRFVPTFLPALAGGLLYGFSPFIMAESLQHPYLSAAVLPPLILLLIDDLVRRKRFGVRRGIALGILAAAQLLVSEEVLAMTALLLVIGSVILGIPSRKDWRDQARAALPTLAVAAATFVILAGYPLLFQLFGPLRPEGLLHPSNLFVNDVLAFVIPGRNQWLSPEPALRLSDRFIGARLVEAGAYLGIPLLIVLAWTAWRHWADLRVRLAVLIGAVLAILSLGYTIHFGGHTSRIPVLVLALIFPALQAFVPGRTLLYTTAAAWFALDRLPLLRQLLPSRLSLFVGLCAALLLAVFFDELPSLTSWRKPAAMIASAIALVSLVPPIPFPTTAATVPRFFSTSAPEIAPQGAVALVVPFAGLHHETPMLWQAVARMRYRMPAGYAFTPGPEVDQVNAPPSFTRDLLWAVEAGRQGAALDDKGKAQLIADLSRWQVRFVVVGPMDHEDQAVALFSQVFGRPPTQTDGVWLWTNL